MQSDAGRDRESDGKGNQRSYLSTSVWMGDLGDLEEQAIISAFAQLGEVVIDIKMMRNPKIHRSSLKPGNYCFVEFPDVDAAQRVLHKLNGRYIPGRPGQRFKLNPASLVRGKIKELMPEFSLYVGDLSYNVQEQDLYKFFRKRYKSVMGAKIVQDAFGKSKGFGFVRFWSEEGQQRALLEMQHMTGLGQRPIKVSLASAKKPTDQIPPLMGGPAAHSSYYAGHYSWGGYNYHFNQSYGHGQPPPVMPQPEYEYPMHPQQPYSAVPPQQQPVIDEDAEVLEDPGLDVNVSKENQEFIESSESFFMALEQSRWNPLDNIMSQLPD